MKRFEDIVIADLDLRKTTWSRVHSSMRTLYLKLNREPETGWVRLFNEERESRVVLVRHGMWIEDGYIVFDCRIEDVEAHHLPDFRKSVEYANRKYREHLAAAAANRALARDEAVVEQQDLETLRARIREEAGLPAPKPDAPLSDFDKTRNEWRARLRGARTAKLKEPERGND
ncbi:MAG TPA: hypothetical protein VF132_13600 [Rudaea sp.]